MFINILEIKKMTLLKAIEEGKDELKRISYPHWNDELIVKADDDNSIWKEHVASSPSVLENEEVRKMKLEEK